MLRRYGPKKFTDLLEWTFRWPKLGDHLFGAPEQPGNNPLFAPGAYERKIFMAEGYKDAGDVLIDEAMIDELGRYGLIYPAIFCYRQCIELSLKTLIETFGGSVGIQVPKHPHDLVPLLRNFRKMLRKYGVDYNETDKAVRKCVIEFARVDPHSFTFRYATQKDGQPYPIRMDSVDLPQLKDVMDGIWGYLDSTDAYLHELVSAA